GYNKGFADGQQDKAKKQKSTTSAVDRKRYQTSDPNFVDDFVYKPNYDLILKALEQKEKQMAKKLKHQNYSESDFKSNFEKAQNILDWIAFLSDSPREYPDITEIFNK